MATKPTLLNSFTVRGHGLDDDQTAALSMLELAILRVLDNPLAYSFMRLQASAQQYSQLGGTGVAVYRKPKRNNWGIDFNQVTGVERQIGGVTETPLYLNQLLTIDFLIPENDMERFRAGTPDIRNGIVNEWVKTIVDNKFFNLELIGLSSIKWYHIWLYGKGITDAVKVLDLSAEAITDQKAAEDAMYEIGNVIIDKTTAITEYEIGTNQSDWTVWFAPKTWLNLSRVYMRLIGSTQAADALASGELYRDQILGTTVSKNMWIDKIVNAGTEQGMNKDKSYDLSGFQGFALHNQNLAFPTAFEKNLMLIDNDTTDLRWFGKIMFGLPEFIRGHLGFIIMDHEPTEGEIEFANSQMAPDWAIQSKGNYEDNMQFAFQPSTYDKDLLTSFNSDGSKIERLDLARGKTGVKGEKFLINQATGKLKLKPREFIVIANQEPTQNIGDELSEADIASIASTSWNALEDGNKYYFMILSPKNTDGIRTFRQVKYIQVMQSTSSVLT